MKTKHLLTALALPAIFAACTADDIVNESANQAQRAALNENFKLNLGGVESRLSAGEPGAAFKFDYEEGDMVGSAIIDKYNPAETLFDRKYETQDYVSTNQPFTFDGSKWTLNHTMVEGKYLFYYPYNEKNNSRGAVQFSIPVMQDLSDKTTGEFNPKAAIEKYGISVGYKFLDKEDLSASIELAPIFSYARLVLKLDNQFAGGEVEKIVLQAPSTQAFKLNGQLNNKEIEKIFKYEASGKDLTTNKDFKWNVYDETADYALPSTALPYYVPELNNTSSVMVGKVPAGTKLTVDAQNNHVFETYMVMPAQEFTSTEKLTVFLYMADGRVYEGETAASLDFNRNTPKKVEVALTAATSTIYIVASQEDWNENVAKMGKTSATFIIADPNFTITNDMKFPEEEGAIITVANVTVSGDNVTLKNIDATTITVAKGAKLTTDVTAKAGNIINKGELVVAANPETRAIVAYDIDAIENHATLTVKEDAVISTALTNKKGAKVVNAGTLTISGTNNGTIDNEGTIYASTAKFLNDEVEFKMVDAKKEIINTPTINNKATGKFRADGEFTNKAMFVNEGILSCKNNAGTIINSLTDDATRENANTFEAAGVIDAKTGSTTYITTNEAKVIVYSMKQANVDVEGGTIEYTSLNATETIDESTVTDIIATKDLEIKWVNATKSKAFENLTVKNAAKVKLTIPADQSLTLESLVVKANTTLASNITTNKLTIAKGAVINVPADYTLTVNGKTVENKGTISVVGKLSVASYLETEASELGDVEDNGVGSLTWKKSVAKANEEAFDTAVYDYFKELLYNSGNGYTSWDAANDASLLTNTLNHVGSNAKRAAVVTAYNTWKGLSGNAAKNNNDADVMAILAEDEAAKAKAAVATLKSEAEAAVNTAIAAAITTKQLSNEWAGTTGYATIGGEEEGQVLTLKTMWIAYANYLKTYMKGWTVKVDGEDTNPYATGSALKTAYILAIESLIADANMDGKDAEGEDVVPGTPALTIPAGSYIDASNKNTTYKAVKAYMTYGGTFAQTVTLLNIQNWYLAASRIEKPGTMDEKNAKDAATLYKDIVVEWTATEYRNECLEVLVDLID